METLTLPVIHFNELQPNRETINNLSLCIIDNILEGHINPLDLPVKKKCIEEALESALKNEGVQSIIQEEIKKHGTKAKHLGATLEVIEAGTKYHFEKCNDPVLLSLEEKANEFADKVKQRKEFLKTVDTKGEVITVQESGETTTVFPPYKTSTTTIKTVLSK